MATWKFLNIGKANAEIERLETELAALKAAGATPPKPADPEKTAILELKIEELSDTICALGDRIGALEKASSDTASGFKVEIARLDKSFSDYQANAKELATRLAAEITGRQGQAPLAIGSTSATTTGGDVEQQLQSITDPKERAQFFKVHEKEIKARMTRNGRPAVK